MQYAKGQKNPVLTERNNKVLEDIQTNSVTEVAKKYGITKQRVSQIVKRYGKGSVEVYRPHMVNYTGNKKTDSTHHHEFEDRDNGQYVRCNGCGQMLACITHNLPRYDAYNLYHEKLMSMDKPKGVPICSNCLDGILDMDDDYKTQQE